MSTDPAAFTTPRWWIAALLNFAGGLGVGYLYVRRPWRALFFSALFLALLVTLWHGLGGLLAEPWVTFVAFAALTVVALTALIDAARLARQATPTPQWYNRWWIYLALVAASGVITYPFNIDRSVRSFYTPAGSMEPTLRVGDRFIVNLRAYDAGNPARGDVVVFALPRDRSVTYVKRVLGLPGDEVQVKGGILHLNGTAVPTEAAGEYAPTASEGAGPDRPGKLIREALGQGRSAVVLDTRADGYYDNTPVFKVPPGHYFMLGDNRDNSTDSRDQSARFGVGYVPRANILGKLAWVYWSSDRSRIGARIN